MRKTLLFGFLLVFTMPLLAVGILPAPEGFVAFISGDTLHTEWLAVEGAAKYSVNVAADYDTDGDTIADISVDFDFGTSDRTDGYLMGDTFLDIPVAELVLWIDSNVDGIEDPGEVFEPVSIKARVKALDPGKLKGRQDNLFCAFDEDMTI